MWWLLIPIAYLVGTFPSAMWVARANGVDIRQVGSGNPGASNVTRVLGWKRGIWVFVLDAAKGAVAAGAGLLIDGRAAGYVLGAAAIVGHVFPVWTKFRGGKGVATGAGVALLPDLVYRPWSLEGDRIESRDVSGSLPAVQVGMVWRRGSSLSQTARDFIGIAQGQRTMRGR